MGVQLSPEELQPLKELIFGLQKQANVQNDAVINILAKELVQKAGVKSFAGSDLVTKIRAYVVECCSGSIQPNEDALRLLVGDESFNIYKNVELRDVRTEYPNPESPKCIFRIVPLNPEDMQKAKDMVNDSPMMQADKQQKMDKIMAVINSNPRFKSIMKDESPECQGCSQNEKIKYLLTNYPDYFKDQTTDMQTQSGVQLDVPTNEEESLYERACKIRDNILKTAPASVKNAIPNDDWAVAVYCAPYYYGVK